jgi:hypothetical protein
VGRAVISGQAWRVAEQPFDVFDEAAVAEPFVRPRTQSDAQPMTFVEVEPRSLARQLQQDGVRLLPARAFGFSFSFSWRS